MKQHGYTPVPTFVTFEVDTFWKVYKFTRWCGLGRFHSWHCAWTQHINLSARRFNKWYDRSETRFFNR